MYADRYSTGPAIKPGSLGLALAATALPLVALVVGLQIKQVLITDKSIPVIDVHTPPPPPIDPPPPQLQPRTAAPPRETVYTPNPLPLPTDNRVETTTDQPTEPPPIGPIQPGPVTADPGPPVAMPVIVSAQVDQRYAGLLQPPYPPEEIRANRVGRVVVRVLIGPDGRVRQVERVSAASDAFFAATQKQALAKWRFKPATRDGVAFEQWKQMTVRFEIPAE